MTVINSWQYGWSRSLALLCGLLLSLAGRGVLADVYKCVDASGQVVYSDAKCTGPGQKLLMVPEVIDPENVRRTQKQVELDTNMARELSGKSEGLQPPGEPVPSKDDLLKQKADLEAKKTAELTQERQQAASLLPSQDRDRLLHDIQQKEADYDKKIQDIDQQLAK